MPRRDALWLATHLFEIAVQDDTYEDVLLALRKTIRESWEAATANEDEGWLVYECNKVEMLLGAAFVICQTKMTSVLEAWAGLQERKTGTRPNPKDALDDGPILNGQPVAWLLWALANYFKHRDEWGYEEWQNPSRQTARTIQLIQSLRLHQDNEGNNLRLAAGQLGCGDDFNVMIFADLIEAWMKALAYWAVIPTPELGDSIPIPAPGIWFALSSC